MDWVEGDVVSPSLEGVKRNDYSLEELEALLDNTYTVEGWRSEVEEEGGDVIHDTNLGSSHLNSDYFKSLQIDTENGFFKMGLDGKHPEVVGLGFDSTRPTVLRLDGFMPAIWEDHVLLINEYGTLSSYNTEEQSVRREGALTEDIVRDLGEILQSKLPADNEAFKIDYVRDSFRDGLFVSREHDVEIEIDTQAYRGIKKYLKDDELASNIYDLCERISRVLDGQDSHNHGHPSDQKSLYRRTGNVDKYSIPGTQKDGRITVTSSENADASIVIAGDHKFYRQSNFDNVCE